jgi:hypothetical protein
VARDVRQARVEQRPLPARKAAAKDGGVRLRRLQAGWADGQWPAGSVVQYHYGTVERANRVALRWPD